MRVLNRCPVTLFAVFPSPIGEWDAFTLVVEGDIDAAAAPTFADAVRAAISVLAGRRLILDFTGVTNLDSTGLRVLAFAQVACQQVGSTLTLRRAPPSVRRVLENGGLAHEIDIEPF